MEIFFKIFMKYFVSRPLLNISSPPQLSLNLLPGFCHPMYRNIISETNFKYNLKISIKIFREIFVKTILEMFQKIEPLLTSPSF